MYADYLNLCNFWFSLNYVLKQTLDLSWISTKKGQDNVLLA